MIGISFFHKDLNNTSPSSITVCDPSVFDCAAKDSGSPVIVIVITSSSLVPPSIIFRGRVPYLSYTSIRGDETILLMLHSSS
uniref:Uncharacterized protein n=1 Tax=uncultured marine virus TaxID=186617 RepID=A0A0F7LA34_9VIRU|nr:hypothetical protein [uncultured marine virus]